MISESDGQGGQLVFPTSLTNTNLVEAVEILFPVTFRWIPFSGQRRSQKCLSQSEARAAILFFQSSKNTYLVEDVKILLPAKFRWIPLGGFREVDNVSADQRQGWPSWLSDRFEKHKLGRRRWVLASCQVLSNNVQRYQRRSRNGGKLTTTDGRMTDNACVTIV